MSEFRRRLLMTKVGGAVPPTDLPQWFKDSIEGWYDIPKQKPTNELLLNNPFLIDYSGHDRNMELKNFNFTGLSGVGEFYCDFQYYPWQINGIATAKSVNSLKKILVNSTDGEKEAVIFLSSSVAKPVKMLLKISNLNGCKLYVGTSSNLSHYLEIDKDGIYDFSYEGSMWQEYLSIGAVVPFKNQNIEVEIIPYSKDYLSFDGYNDYAVNKQYPMLTDYEVIAERIWKRGNGFNSYLCGKSISVYNDGAFLFENNPYRDNNAMGTVSYGFESKIHSIAEYGNITYQNTNSYNGKFIANGGSKDNSNIVTIAGSRPTAEQKADILLKRLFIFNRTLQESERNWVIDNLMK